MTSSNDAQRDLKAIKHLYEKDIDLERDHTKIQDDIMSAKERLRALARVGSETPIFTARKQAHLDAMEALARPLDTGTSALFRESVAANSDYVYADAILTVQERNQINARIQGSIDDFNRRHGLDAWDYAIAGGAGLFGAMLDFLCVRAPPKPTVAWTEEVDGVFNRAVQNAFNRILPPEVSAALGEANKIGSADASTVARLVGAPPGALNPLNHRLRSLSHDPVLGCLLGAVDMMWGTCTVVGDRGVEVFQGTDAPVPGGFFGALGRMFGHLLSDVNAPSIKGNRGIGLPAPFMGVLRMFNGIPAGNSNLGKQVEYMYVNGYDFRQFTATSVPVLIMEVVMRVFYAVKQVKLAEQPLGHVLMETMPTRMNPRFRIMLALGYGCMTAVNSGRIYVTKDIMNLNYTAWMGLIWNGFHAMKWALLDSEFRLWDQIESQEIKILEETVILIDRLESRAADLPLRQS